MKIKNEALIFIIRNKLFSAIILITLVIIFLGEIFSFALINATQKGEEEAYVYNGFALYLEPEKISLKEEDYFFLNKLNMFPVWEDILVR